MTTLLTITDKQAQAAAIAAQYAEFLASGGRPLQVTKDTVIPPQPQAKWIAPTTAKPLQVIAPKTAPKPKPQSKPPAPAKAAKNRSQKSSDKRVAILQFIRKAGKPVTRTQIAEALGFNKKGGVLDMIRDMLAKDLIKVSSVVGLVHYFEVTT